MALLGTVNLYLEWIMYRKVESHVEEEVHIVEIRFPREELHFIVQVERQIEGEGIGQEGCPGQGQGVIQELSSVDHVDLSRSLSKLVRNPNPVLSVIVDPVVASCLDIDN